MTKVFLYLANRSIVTGFLILAVIGLRFLFRKLPKGPQLLLWAVVALRLAVPFSPESSWSLLPSTEPLFSQTAIHASVRQYASHARTESEISVPAATDAPHPTTAAAPTAAAQPQADLPASPGASETPAASGLGDLDVFFLICTAVWLLGMAAMTAYGLVSYLRLRKSSPSACGRMGAYTSAMRSPPPSFWDCSARASICPRA